MARRKGGAEVWRERLRRFEAGGLTVRAFCAQEGVSEPSFYHWRRRLGSNGGTSASASRAGRCAFAEVRVTAAVGVLSIALPGGVRVELPADHVELARLVVREVTLASWTGGSGEA